MKRLLSALVVGLAIGVSACGSSPSESGGAASASGGPTRDTLVIGISRKLTSLDPATAAR